MELDDTTINIDGLAGKDTKTVRSAYVELETLCGGDRTQQAKALFVATLRRFQALREELKAWESSGGKPVDAVMFIGALKKFLEKVRTYSTLSLADRLVDYKYLLSFVDSIHSGRDSLTEVERRLKRAQTGEDTEQSGPWEGQATLDEAKAAYVTVLASAMDAFVEAASQNLVANQLRLAEAEVILKAATKTRDPLKLNDLVAKYTPMVADLARRAQVPALNASLPEWFILKDKVQFDDKVLARGSFGSVHRGTWGSGTKVVVKKLFVNTGENSVEDKYFSLNLQKEFMKEADLWAKLKHPYVCQLWGACHVSEPPFMVCESAVKNGNLLDYIHPSAGKSTAGKKRFWRLLYHTALGVEYLHDKNIIHGDLKLNNVLVGDDGYSRVTDFGLSRFKRSSDDYMTRVEEGVQSAGALRWRAPECIGSTMSPQKTSDVYSLAMCIYEAFAGQAPYAGIPNEGVENRITEGTLPDKPENCPEEAWKLIKKMTAKDLKDRPDIATVTTELYKFVAEEEKKEYEGIQVCVICGTEVPAHGNKRCSKCLKVVETRQKDGTEPFTIKSKDDLPRVVEMVATKSDAQRLSATSALKTYVFGDPTHQKEVSDARAMAVLAKTVRTRKEAEAIQRECQVTLGCIAVGNSIGQQDAEYEEVIPRLIEVLNNGPERLKNKAVMVLGYLSYGNATNHQTIVTTENVLAKIKEMLHGGTDDEKRAAKKALAILESPPSQATSENPTAADAA